MSGVTRPYHDDGQATFYLGDVVKVLRALAAESVSAVVTDPPYGLGFMGKVWDSFATAAVAERHEVNKRKGTSRSSGAWPDRDGSGVQGNGVAIKYDESPRAHRRYQHWCEEWASEALRVAKPGAHLVAFGGPRTFHRLTCGIEDAGWEIRDCMAWLFGSGFPKSLNLHGEWEGWGTALKPGWEPIVLARKPFTTSVIRNVEEHGTGGLNIAACRVGELGRWPANVLVDVAAAAMLDGQAGNRRSGPAHVLRRGATTGRGMGYGSSAPGDVLDATYGDEGGPSRFFYTSKTPRAERELNLHDLDPVRRSDGRRKDIDHPRLRTSSRRNHHPTVKPVDVMRWLVRLVTPPDGVVLDPFIGSGSTAIAAKAEGFRVIGIDREAEYLEIAWRRAAQQGLIGAVPPMPEMDDVLGRGMPG